MIGRGSRRSIRLGWIKPSTPNDSWCFFYEFSQAVAIVTNIQNTVTKHSYQPRIFGWYFQSLFYAKKFTFYRWLSWGYTRSLAKGVDRIIHGTKVYYYLHGSYGYRTASKLLLWFLCHVYGEPLNNPFTMTFSPLTLCRTIVVWPTKKFNEWWKRRCRHCQLRVEKDISAYGTGDEIYVPWTQMTPVEWLELIGPSFGGNVSPPKHRTLTGSVL